MNSLAAPVLAPPTPGPQPACRTPRAARSPAVGNQALLRRLQPKLAIGAVDDPLEREADAVADQVMRMPAPRPAINASPQRISRKCAECREEAETTRLPRPLETVSLQQHGDSTPIVRRAEAPAQQAPPQPAVADAGGAPRAASTDDDLDAGAPSSCAQVASVPDYCKPFPSQDEAIKDRTANGDAVLAKVKGLNSRAEELYRKFIYDPGPAGDISKSFAKDFTFTTAAAATTDALVAKLKEVVDADPSKAKPGTPVDIGTLLSGAAITQIAEANLRFTDYTSIPGLIAGGVDKSEASCIVGKYTAGAKDDSRSAAGKITFNRSSDGSIQGTPDFTYTVEDTLDFCPGNPGSKDAQELTVPLSRWEASSISGDVPFTVTFPNPVGVLD